MSDPKVPDYWTIVHEDETVILKEELDRLRAELEVLKSAEANKDWLALVADNKRLRAENERLATETTQAAQRNLDLRVENDSLRAELEIRREAVKELNTANHELIEANGHLRTENAELKEWITSLNAKECDRLRAEIAELREVLLAHGMLDVHGAYTVADKIEALLAKTAKGGGMSTSRGMMQVFPDMGTVIKDLKNEIDRLRAKVEELHNGFEIEGHVNDRLRAENAKLKDLNAELREALRLFVTEGLSRSAANRLLAKTAKEGE